MMPLKGSRRLLSWRVIAGGVLAILLLAFTAEAIYRWWSPTQPTPTPIPAALAPTEAAVPSLTPTTFVAPVGPVLTPLPEVGEEERSTQPVIIITPTVTLLTTVTPLPTPSLSPLPTQTDTSTVAPTASFTLSPIATPTNTQTPNPTSTTLPTATSVMNEVSPTVQIAESVQLLPTSTPTVLPTVVVPASVMLGAAPAIAPEDHQLVSGGQPLPQILGLSTDGHPIESYQFGTGPIHLALIGGIHGGYEWNTVLLAYAVIDAFSQQPDIIPAVLTIHVVPAANPDGVARVVGHSGRFSAGEVGDETKPGRFNGNFVDLNRNWDCKWQPQGVWGDQPVDAGSAPMSETETEILATMLTEPPMDAVVFWHSAVSEVLPGGCDSVFEPARALAELYGEASGYPVDDSFDYYTVTGDAADWLSRQGVAAITVELSTHNDIEWDKNWVAVQTLMLYLVTEP